MAQPATIWPAAVSERSAALVSGPLRPALVVAAFPTALYLVVEDPGCVEPGRPLLPVVARGGLRLPTAVTLATEVPEGDWGVQPGASVVVGRGSIRLPRAVVAGVRTWRPRRMPSVAGTLPGPALAVLSDLPHDPLRHDARALAEELAGRRAPTARVGALVGAGAGLTPSGDDVLCGVLLALRLLGPDAQPLAATLWEAVRMRLASTTSLSASLLTEAAQGYAVPPVVHLGEALVAGSTDGVLRHAGEVAAIGHTSGTDLLAGLVGCLDGLVALAQPSAPHSRPEPVDLLRSTS